MIDSQYFIKQSDYDAPRNWLYNNNSEMEPLLSIVVPAFNEGENIEYFCSRVSVILDSMGILWEIVFVNDGSQDNSAEIMRQMYEKDSRIKSVIFARNFGNQIAIAAGLRASSGRAVIVMDADLQQPPEIIPQMFELWKNGYHVVNAVYQGYGKEVGWLKKTTSAYFYKFMNFISDIKLEPNSSEFRLMDRVVVNVLLQMPERTQFIRGLIRWMGFRQISIPFQLNVRHAGTPAFTMKKLFRLALDGIISFSSKPLYFIIYMALFCFILIIPWFVYDIYRCMFTNGNWNLASILVPLNLIIGGTILFAVGIIGLYINSIYSEVKRRPLFTVQEQYGLDEVDFAYQPTIGHSWQDANQKME